MPEFNCAIDNSFSDKCRNMLKYRRTQLRETAESTWRMQLKTKAEYLNHVSTCARVGKILKPCVNSAALWALFRISMHSVHYLLNCRQSC